MNLTIGVALARLLSPDDFGLLGMVLVVTGLFGLLSDLGLSTAVVQKQDLTQREMSSVFWFNIGVATLLALLIAGASPLAAKYYAQPQVIPVMCAVSLMFPLGALGSVQYALLQKEMRFKDATKIHVGSSLAAGGAALLAALAGWKVWALVTQSLVVAAGGAAGLWCFSRWRPDWRFAIEDLRRIWGFSLNLTGFQIVNYFARRADSFLIGRSLGAGALGFYTLAYTLMIYPISNLISVAQGVLVPAMSQVQNEPQRIAGAYIRACRYLAFLILPAMTGLALIATEAVQTVYGAKWAETGRVLAVLAWVGTFQPFDSLLGALFVARGFTRWFFWWGLAASVFTVTGFVIGLRWGIVGVAYSYLVTQALLVIFGVPLQCRKVQVSLSSLLKALSIPAMAAAVMGLAVFTTKITLVERGVTQPAVLFAACVGVGVVVYGGLLLVMRNYFWDDMKGEFARIFRREQPAPAA